MKTLVTTDKVTQPDTEEYTVIIDALSRAKTTLYSLLIHQALEAEPAPEGTSKGHASLLAFLTRGQAKRPLGGPRLQQEIDGARAQVRVLERQLEAYNAHQDAWDVARTAEAA